MKTNYILIILATIVAFTSCEKIIDISIPESERKLVLNGLLIAGKPIEIKLSKSVSVFEENAIIDIVSNAKVEVFENEILLGEATHINSGWYRLDNKAIAGAKYTLKVTQTGLQHIIAETTVPNQDFSFKTDTVLFISEWGQRMYKLKYSATTNTSNKSFYMLKPYEKPSVYYFINEKGLADSAYYTNYYGAFQTQDPSLISNWYGEFLFSSETFSNNTKNIDFDFNISNSNTTVYIDYYAISEDFYKHRVTISKYMENSGNPLVEPVLVYSNVNGGLGFLGGAMVKSDSIVFKNSSNKQ